MEKNKETKLERDLANVCYECGLPYGDKTISINNPIYGPSCGNCGKIVGTFNHPWGDVRHESLRVYSMDVTKTLQQKINDLVSISNYNNRNNIFRVGTFNSPRHRLQIPDMSKAFAKMILEEKLDICTLQEFTSYPTHVSEELIKIPGAYDYTYTYQPFHYQGGKAGNGIISHLPLTNVTNSQDKEENPDIHIKGVININGKKVSVYSIHFDAYNPGLMAYQLKKCADTVAKDPNKYKIVAGDFNCGWWYNYVDKDGKDVPKYNAWQPLLDLGFEMAFSFDNPEHHMSNGQSTIDNILYTKDTIRLLDCYKACAPDWIADHDLCCAEFKLL